MFHECFKKNISEFFCEIKIKIYRQNESFMKFTMIFFAKFNMKNRQNESL